MTELKNHIYDENNGLMLDGTLRTHLAERG